jgi:hypothetical protein
MTTAIDLISDPNLGIDPITSMTTLRRTGSQRGYTNSELEHFRIGHGDINSLVLQVIAFGKKNHPERHDARTIVSDATFEDSIDKTNTFTLVVHDPDWDLLNTGALDKPIDLNPGNIPNLIYRRDSFEVSNDDITITFVTRNAAYMSYYKRPKKANRKNTTRAEFLLSLTRDVKEAKIPFVCPQLHQNQKIARTQFPNEIARRKGREHGFTASDKITVKGATASPAQRQTIEKVILAGEDLKMPGLVIVSAVMCITQESTAGAGTTGNPPYVGAFQQNRSDGWPGTGDAYKDAKGNGKIGVKQGGYYGYAYGIWKAHGGDMDLGLLVATTQGVIGSTNPLNNGYAQSTNRWRGEAQHAVNAFGGIDVSDPGSSTHNVYYKQKYEFMVGPPDGNRNENYLAASYRLADEVNWSAFWVRDALHFISEEDLFKSKPQASMRRFGRGIEGVSFGWDTQQRINQMTLSVRMERWVCPLGTVVHFEEGGPAEGRWLVTNIRRSMFDELGEITLSKPMREKMEPANQPGERQVRSGGKNRSITDISGTTVDGFNNPFPDGWTPGRLDMGYDGTFRNRIVAPFDGLITYAAQRFSNWGGFIVLQSPTDIGLPTKTLYFAEGLSPTVHTNQSVKAGQTIATPTPSVQGGAGSIEWGVGNEAHALGPVDPYGKTLGGGSSSASAASRNMVLEFSAWCQSVLGLPAPSTTADAGHF